VRPVHDQCLVTELTCQVPCSGGRRKSYLPSRFAPVPRRGHGGRQWIVSRGSNDARLRDRSKRSTRASRLRTRARTS
jgi:hypothetical protein